MRIETLLPAAVAAAMLVACASPGPHEPTHMRGSTVPFSTVHPCQTQDCSVDVAVVATANDCIPTVVGIIDARGGVAGARNITWTITTTGYEFSRESYKYGIFIKSDPDEEFKNVQITGDGKSLSLKFDRRATGKDYAYALTVRRTSGDKGFCKTLDPWLIS
jgi:hypothetical protein